MELLQNNIYFNYILGNLSLELRAQGIRQMLSATKFYLKHEKQYFGLGKSTAIRDIICNAITNKVSNYNVFQMMIVSGLIVIVILGFLYGESTNLFFL